MLLVSVTAALHWAGTIPRLGELQIHIIRVCLDKACIVSLKELVKLVRGMEPSTTLSNDLRTRQI